MQADRQLGYIDENMLNSVRGDLMHTDARRTKSATIAHGNSNTCRRHRTRSRQARQRHKPPNPHTAP
eukprot:8274946-Pyramimonas_sp.AAC.1